MLKERKKGEKIGEESELTGKGKVLSTLSKQRGTQQPCMSIQAVGNELLLLPIVVVTA